MNEPSTYSSSRIWADGSLIAYDDATLHVLSHATQRGSAVFDVIKIVDAPGPNGDDASAAGLASHSAGLASHSAGLASHSAGLASHSAGLAPHAVGLRGHVARFVASMELMSMDTPYSVEELEAAVKTTVAANPGARVVKLVAAWAEVPLRTLPVSLTPNVWIAAMNPGDQSDVPSAAGIRLRSATGPKTPAAILPPNLKVAASYTAGVRQRMAAIAAGFDDVLFRTTEGALAEATTQSLFVVSQGQIAVPPLDIVLDGITRKMMIDLAGHAGLRVSVRSIEWHEVESASELFLSSANHCVVPVSALDERSYVSPGPITQQLAKAAEDLLAGRHSLSSRWLTDLKTSSGCA